MKANPDAMWWIKGDGCDIVPGLCELVQLKWSGDVDLNDGKVQNDYKLYKSKLDFMSGLGLGSRQERSTNQADLKVVYQQIRSDNEFATKGTLNLMLNASCLELCIQWMF